MSTHHKMGLLAACLAICAGIASAEVVVSYKGYFSGAPGTTETPLSGQVNLPKYDGPHQVQSVIISGSVGLEGFSALLENTGTESAYINEYEYGMRGTFAIVPTSTEDTVAVTDSVFSVSVPADDSVYYEPDLSASSVFASNGNIASANFGLFTGLGDFSITYSITQRSMLDSAGSLASTIEPGTSDGWFQVDYVIPEPTTGAFWALCGVMIFLRRRLQARC